MLSKKSAVTIGTSPCAYGRAPKASRFPIRELPAEERFRKRLVGIGGAEQCRLSRAKRRTYARAEVYGF